MKCFTVVMQVQNPSNALHRLRSSKAFSLIENMIACGVISAFLGGVFTLNSQALSMLRMGRDEASASQVLQQRIEQIRIANWQRLSDPTWIRDNIMNADADGSSGLKNLQETVTLAPYNSATGSTNTFTRSAGSATASGSNASLINEMTIRITWQVSWTGVPSARTHTRQTTVILGKGGVAKY